MMRRERRLGKADRMGPAIVTGAIAPDKVNGVITLTCPCSAIAISPSHIGISNCNGELVLMIPNKLTGSASRATPNISAAISIPSIVRANPSVWVCQLLSKSVICAR